MNLRILKYLSLPFLSIFIGTPLHAQGVEKETKFEHWQGIGAEYEINKKLEFNFSLETRWQTDPSELNVAFFEIEPSYELFNNLEIAGGYRFSTDFEDKRQRWYIHMEPKVEMTKDFTMDIRLRFDRDEEDDEISERLRWRLKPEYDFGQHEVFALVEQFLQDAKIRTRWRYGIGYQYKMNKKSTLTLKWLLDSEIDKNVHILSLGYKHEF